MSSYMIPKGTPVAVAKVAPRHLQWQRHTTRVQLQFDRILKSDDAHFVFQHTVWYIYVHHKNVRRVQSEQ